MTAVEMLTTGDTVIARERAEELDRCNTQRQGVEQSIVSQAHAMIRSQGGLGDRGAIVLGSPEWHPGVIGIVAGRLAETYHRPSIIVALKDPISQGSGRSISGFDLYEALNACGDGLLGFGGHQAAAGLKLHPGDFEAFAERFELHCRSSLRPEQLRKVLTIDAEIVLGMLTVRQVEEIDSLEPYGIGNPRPVLMASRVQIVGEPRAVGPRQNHLQFRVQQGGSIVKAIGWSLAEKGKDLAAGMTCSLAFTPTINEWNRRRDVQLEVKDFQTRGIGIRCGPGLYLGRTCDRRGKR